MTTVFERGGEGCGVPTCYIAGEEVDVGFGVEDDWFAGGEFLEVVNGSGPVIVSISLHGSGRLEGFDLKTRGGRAPRFGRKWRRWDCSRLCISCSNRGGRGRCVRPWACWKEGPSGCGVELFRRDGSFK